MTSPSARPARAGGTLRAVPTRVRVMTAVAAVVAAGVTLALALESSLRFAFESPELRAVLEATQALIAAMAAYLVYGRVRRYGRRNDLLIVYTLALSAVTNLFFMALPDGGESALTFQTWGRLLSRIAAGLALAWAAVAHDRALRNPRRAALTVVAAVDATLLVVAVSVGLLVDRLPPGSEVAIDADGRAVPELWGHPALLVANLLLFAIFIVVAFGFASRADRRPDPMFTALAVGSALRAFSWLHFAAYPSIFSEVVQVGDALRLAFYVALLLGAEREIQTWWTRVASAAANEERRRLARDLHDGLAQELAFITRESRLLARDGAAPGAADRIAASSERALDEARSAITALTTDDVESLDVAIAHAAEDVAWRVGTEVRLDLSPDVEVGPAAREALLRIVRESVTNAGRHGGASTVTVALREDGVLSIEDDGCGFDLEHAATKGRFGLISMRERAEGLGARFRITSKPGRGTRVEVGLP